MKTTQQCLQNVHRPQTINTASFYNIKLNDETKKNGQEMAE